MKFFLFIFFFLWFSVSYIFGQATEKDSTEKKSGIIENKADTVSSELILNEIRIKGQIDRPNVIVIPKRVKTDVVKIDLKRNFKEEVNQADGDIPELNKELRKIEKIKSINKAVNKKRTKNEKKKDTASG